MNSDCSVKAACISLAQMPKGDNHVFFLRFVRSCVSLVLWSFAAWNLCLYTKKEVFMSTVSFCGRLTYSVHMYLLYSKNMVCSCCKYTYTRPYVCEYIYIYIYTQ